MAQSKLNRQIKKHEWHMANAERVNLKKRADYKINKDAIALRNKTWKDNNQIKVVSGKKKWRVANPDKVRAANLRNMHGLTLEEYDRMLVIQNGKCKICKEPPHGKTKISKVLHVDHDHKTNVIRGLLCMACNRGIGAFRDRHEIFLSAIIYLKLDEKLGDQNGC